MIGLASNQKRFQTFVKIWNRFWLNLRLSELCSNKWLGCGESFVALVLRNSPKRRQGKLSGVVEQQLWRAAIGRDAHELRLGPSRLHFR